MWLIRVSELEGLGPVYLNNADIYPYHYHDVIMSGMASQITTLTIVYSRVYSGTDERKYQSSVSLAFVRRIHRWLVNSPHKGPVTQKMFPFDDIIMWNNIHQYCSLNWYIDSLMLDCSNSNALAMELLQSCTKSSTCPFNRIGLNYYLFYRKVSNIRCTLVGNKIVDHSDVVWELPVGAVPTTSSFST